MILGRRDAATPIVYGASAAISGFLLAVAAFRLLLGPGPIDAGDLRLRHPWIGAHFRIDALSAFFLAVINLGGGGGEPLRHRLRPP